MRNFPASSSYFASAVTRVIALKELPSSIRHIWRLWPRLFIVVHDGARLRMEDAKALRERLDVVIRTLD